MSRPMHLSALVDGLDIYADHAVYHVLPYWLLTPEQVAYLAGEPTRTPISIERQRTRGSGDIITYRTETSEISVLYSPIVYDRGWYESEEHGGSEILGSEIVRYVIGALGLSPPVEGATRSVLDGPPDAMTRARRFRAETCGPQGPRERSRSVGADAVSEIGTHPHDLRFPRR